MHIHSPILVQIKLMLKPMTSRGSLVKAAVRSVMLNLANFSEVAK